MFEPNLQRTVLKWFRKGRCDFERSGGVIGDEDQSRAFVVLIQAMPGDSTVKSVELEPILLGPDERQAVNKRLKR